MDAPKNRQNDLSAKLPAMPGLAEAPYLLLILMVFLAYSNVYDNEFLFDDLGLITGNKFLTSWHYIGALFRTSVMQGHGVRDPFYRPLQMLLYLFIYQAAGPSTVAFHLLNVGLHTLNACLLYALGIRLGFHRVATFLAALLWALHPVQTEAVTYMSGTADPLCGVFLLAGILVLAVGFTRRRLLAACVLFALALLSKETAVVFPLLAMGLLFYHSEDRWSLKTYLKTWPFWLIAILYFVARTTVLNFNNFLGFYNAGAVAETTIIDHFYTFLATLPSYLRLLVWPTGLYLVQNFPIYTSFWTLQTMAGFSIFIVIGTAIFWKPSRRASPLAWGLLWATGMHLSQSGILVPTDAVFMEHWLYLPTMGLFLGIGESLARAVSYIRDRYVWIAPVSFAVILGCLFGVMTFVQNGFWRDSIVFYNHIFDCGEDSSKLRNNLGNAYESKSQYELAIKQYRLALAFSDNNADAHYNLGASMLALGQGPAGVAESMAHFQRAIEINPDLLPVYDELADLYAYQADHTKEAECRAKAAAIRKKLEIE